MQFFNFLLVFDLCIYLFDQFWEKLVLYLSAIC